MSKHLGSNERYQIQIGLASGSPVSAIAQGLGYNKSAVYRERSPATPAGDGYDAQFAPQTAKSRAVRSRNAGAIEAKIWQAVDHYLLCAHSSEQIADKLAISHDTMYRHIYPNKKSGGCLHLFLRCQKAYRKRCNGSDHDRRGSHSQSKAYRRARSAY